MEEDKEGVSIADIFKIIFSEKWLTLVIAVLITVGGTLGLYFGYNAYSTYYVSTFSVSFPGSDESVPVYPDNTPFNYRDIISRSNLSEINSDERFKSINVIDMYASSALSISRNDRELSADKLETTYTIRIKAKYFANQSQAEAFIDELAQTPMRYIKKLAVDQDLYLSDYGNTDFYEDKVELLKNQVDYLNLNLKNLSRLTGGTLKSECLRLITQLSQYTQKLDTAIGEMRKNLYVHDVEKVKENYSSMLISLESRRENKRNELNLLFGKINEGDATVDIMQTSERIETLANEIAELESRITIYKAYTAEGAALKLNPEFSQRLADLNAQLKSVTDSYEGYLAQYYAGSSLVAYEGAIHPEGNLGVIVSILIALIAGVIIAMVVGFVVGYLKLSKAKKAEKNDKKDEE